MADLDDARGMSAEEQVRAARREYGARAFAESAFSPKNDKTPDVAGVVDEALCRTRTGDPFLTMEVLYQLS